MFSERFLSHVDDIRIIGIGLTEHFAEEFLDTEDTYSKLVKEWYGIEQLLVNKSLIDKEPSKMSGYEVLGFEHGLIHSYICNGLEKHYREKFSFSLNENGFIPTLKMAMNGCDYSNDEEAGTEPVLWLP